MKAASDDPNYWVDDLPLVSAFNSVEKRAPYWRKPEPISPEEWDYARIAPPALVDNYLYRDLALLSGAGGTGKTTLILWEALHIVLRRDLYGRTVRVDGWVLILTAEDSRELLTARLRHLADAMNLTRSEIERVRKMIRICDLTGMEFHLAANIEGQILVTGKTNEMIESLKDDPPSLVIIDPYISFSPGEKTINDGAQGMVTAARRMIRELGCCVRYVHHLSQDAYRNGVKDQYAGRGATALPDGCRMVALLVNVTDNSCAPDCLTSMLKEGGQLFELHLPKLSYCPPQRPILIARKGWKFLWAEKPVAEDAERMKAHMDEEKVLEFIRDKLSAGRRYSKSSASDQHALIGISRARARAAIDRLLSSGKLKLVKLPKNERHGRLIAVLHPANKAET